MNLLSVFLTITNDNEPKKNQKIRQRVKNYLGDWRKCGEIVNGLNDEKRFIDDLIHGCDLLSAIKNIKIVGLFIHSFSSYLFNLALSKYIQDNKKIERNLQIDKIGSNTQLTKRVSDLYSLIFQQAGISLSVFNNLHQEFNIRGRLRSAFFGPKNFNFRRGAKDFILNFDLGNGEYASLFLDYIFNNRLGIKLN